MQFNTDLFDKEHVARLADHFIAFLSGCARSPQARVSEVPLVTPQECDLLLRKWNETDFPVPAGMSALVSALLSSEFAPLWRSWFGDADLSYDIPHTHRAHTHTHRTHTHTHTHAHAHTRTRTPSPRFLLIAEPVYQLFEQQARETPSAVAVQDNGTVWTYADLNERANRLARVVRDSIDWDAVANGDREPLIGVMCEVRWGLHRPSPNQAKTFLTVAGLAVQ